MIHDSIVHLKVMKTSNLVTIFPYDLFCSKKSIGNILVKHAFSNKMLKKKKKTKLNFKIMKNED